MSKRKASADESLEASVGNGSNTGVEPEGLLTRLAPIVTAITLALAEITRVRDLPRLASEIEAEIVTNVERTGAQWKGSKPISDSERWAMDCALNGAAIAQRQLERKLAGRDLTGAIGTEERQARLGALRSELRSLEYEEERIHRRADLDFGPDALLRRPNASPDVVLFPGATLDALAGIQRPLTQEQEASARGVMAARESQTERLHALSRAAHERHYQARQAEQRIARHIDKIRGALDVRPPARRVVRSPFMTGQSEPEYADMRGVRVSDALLREHAEARTEVARLAEEYRVASERWRQSAGLVSRLHARLRELGLILKSEGPSLVRGTPPTEGGEKWSYYERDLGQFVS